ERPTLGQQGHDRRRMSAIAPAEPTRPCPGHRRWMSQRPLSFLLEPVVVSAQRLEIALGGRASCCVIDSMVLVRLASRGAAAGEQARTVAHLNPASQLGVGESAARPLGIASGAINVLDTVEQACDLV